MALLTDDNAKELKAFFKEKVPKPMKVVLFTQGMSSEQTNIEVKCDMCKESEQLMQEVAALSENIELVVYDFIADKEKAQEMNIDKIPAIVLLGENQTNSKIRYFGIPSGYEFSGFMQDIAEVSAGETALKPEIKENIRKIEKPMHIQVFVTPTCPYCPRAVRIAHQFAMENKNFTADMVEATEFMPLSQKYSVMGVPKIVINDKIYFEGALPEPLYAIAVRKAAGETISESEENSIAQYVKPFEFAN
ncbi:MAG: protein disulfide oxidoreductase [Promethearchaeota archaeon]